MCLLFNTCTLYRLWPDSNYSIDWHPSNLASNTKSSLQCGPAGSDAACLSLQRSDCKMQSAFFHYPSHSDLRWSGSFLENVSLIVTVWYAVQFSFTDTTYISRGVGSFSAACKPRLYAHLSFIWAAVVMQYRIFEVWRCCNGWNNPLGVQRGVWED